MALPRGHSPPSPWPPLFFLLLFLLLLISSPLRLQARPLLLHPSINVAVVFSGSSYQNEVRGRLSGENFVDLPVVVSPVTVLVNDTNPRDLLTRLCDTMATEKLHGVVFEDDVGSGAGAQVKNNFWIFVLSDATSSLESWCSVTQIHFLKPHEATLYVKKHLSRPKSQRGTNWDARRVPHVYFYLLSLQKLNDGVGMVSESKQKRCGIKSKQYFKGSIDFKKPLFSVQSTAQKNVQLAIVKYSESSTFFLQKHHWKCWKSQMFCDYS